MKPEKILFYSDLSSDSDCSFQMALETVFAHRCRHFYIIHVLQSPYRFHGEIVDPGLAMSLNPEILDVAQLALKDRYASALRGYPGASFHVLNGAAGIEILRFVRTNEIDLVLIAQSVAQRSRAVGSDNLGSFLNERCPCPVLLVVPGRRNRAKAGGETGDGRRAKVLSMERYRLKRAQST